MNTNIDQDLQNRLMNEREAAAYLCYTVRALQNWRVRGGGPKFIKVSSRSIRYTRHDLNEWIEARKISNTAQYVPKSFLQ
jgi:predicted DNA-binding transcriptional regulator AlpA